MCWSACGAALRTSFATALLGAALLAACSDGGTGAGRTPAVLVALTPTAFSSSNALPVDPPPSVKVADAIGEGVSGMSVRFSVLAGGGTITGGTPDNATDEQVLTSNADGVVSLASWTLGELTGDTTGTANLVIARLVANGIALDSLTFTATATGNSWSQRAPATGTGSYAAVAVIDGLLYASGEGGSGIYDPATDSWGPLPPPAVGRTWAGGAALDSRFYLVGGLGSAPECLGDFSPPACPTVEAYDPGTGRWATLAPMAQERFNPVVAALGGQVYAVGGVNGTGNVLNSAERYDPVANSWSPIASFPHYRNGPWSGTALGGRLYLVSEVRIPAPTSYGADAIGVDIYDPVTNNWSAGTSLPAALVTPGLLGEPKVTVLRGRLYLQGLAIENGWFTRTWLAAYDPGTDRWIPKADLPLAPLAQAQCCAGLTVVGAVLYTVGGYPDPDMMRAFVP